MLPVWPLYVFSYLALACAAGWLLCFLSAAVCVVLVLVGAAREAGTLGPGMVGHYVRLHRTGHLPAHLVRTEALTRRLRRWAGRCGWATCTLALLGGLYALGVRRDQLPPRPAPNHGAAASASGRAALVP